MHRPFVLLYSKIIGLYLFLTFRVFFPPSQFLISLKESTPFENVVRMPREQVAGLRDVFLTENVFVKMTTGISNEHLYAFTRTE